MSSSRISVLPVKLQSEFLFFFFLKVLWWRIKEECVGLGPTGEIPGSTQWESSRDKGTSREGKNCSIMPCELSGLGASRICLFRQSSYDLGNFGFTLFSNRYLILSCVVRTVAWQCNVRLRGSNLLSSENVLFPPVFLLKAKYHEIVCRLLWGVDNSLLCDISVQFLTLDLFYDVLLSSDQIGDLKLLSLTEVTSLLLIFIINYILSSFTITCMATFLGPRICILF